jgi:hypothetical protein
MTRDILEPTDSNPVKGCIEPAAYLIGPGVACFVIASTVHVVVDTDLANVNILDQLVQNRCAPCRELSMTVGKGDCSNGWRLQHLVSYLLVQRILCLADGVLGESTAHNSLAML